SGWSAAAGERSESLPRCVPLTLRAPDDALHEPVHRVQVRQDLEGRALRYLQLPALVVERAGEDVERAVDDLRPLRGDHRLRLRTHVRAVRSDVREAVLHVPVVE